MAVRKHRSVPGYHRWTEARDAELRAYRAAGKTPKQMAESMGITSSSISHRLGALGLAHGHLRALIWTEERNAILARMWPAGERLQDVMHALGIFGRGAIKGQVTKLKLKRPPRQSFEEQPYKKTSPWNPEKDAMLIAGKAAGKSYTQMTAEIGLSRNALIGRANRLGIASPRRLPTAQEKAATAAAREIRRKEAKQRRYNTFTGARIAPHSFNRRYTDVVPQNIPFDKMRFGRMCAYPTHEADSSPTYCGHGVGLKRNGKPSPYCQGHHQVAHT